MTHEGTRLSIAAGMVSEHVGCIFSNCPWLQASCAPGTMMSCKQILEDLTPLPQVLCKHEAANIVFVASEDSLATVMMVMQHVQRSLSMNTMHLLVLGPTDRPLYDGAAHLREKVPWAHVHALRSVSSSAPCWERLGSSYMHGIHKPRLLLLHKAHRPSGLLKYALCSR